MPTSVSADQIDYVCPSGHRVHGETVEFRVNGKGNRYPNCRTCRQAYRRKYRRRPEVLAKKRAAAEEKRLARNSPPPTLYSLSGTEIPWSQYMGKAEKRSSPWNALRPRPEASLPFDEFNEALKYTDVPCRGRATEFTEYQDPRPAWSAENEGRLPMPTADEAATMCARCPLWDLCDNYASADKPDFGIFGGKRWLGGKVVP